MTRRAKAALLVVALALAPTACGASARDRARLAAHAHERVWEPETLRLGCDADDLAVEELRVDGELPGFARRAVGRLDVDDADDGSLWVAWCPAVRCCGRRADESLAEIVVVRCSADGCRAVGDTLGDCLTVDCSTF